MTIAAPSMMVPEAQAAGALYVSAWGQHEINLEFDQNSTREK
jgi:hypothetical protein